MTWELQPVKTGEGTEEGTLPFLRRHVCLYSASSRPCAAPTHQQVGQAQPLHRPPEVEGHVNVAAVGVGHHHVLGARSPISRIDVKDTREEVMNFGDKVISGKGTCQARWHWKQAAEAA